MAKKRKKAKTKASRKSTAKRKTKVSKARKVAVKSKRKPAKKTKRKAKTKSKPKTLRQRVAGAFDVVTDTIRGTDTLRNKMEPPATSETE